jgi:sugar (pentulose or hexulose) kinase
MEINTLFQLFALLKEKPELAEVNAKMLMIPDLIGWALTGKTMRGNDGCWNDTAYKPRDKAMGF